MKVVIEANGLQTKKVVIEDQDIQPAVEFHCIKLDKDCMLFVVQNKTNAPIHFGLPHKGNPEYGRLSFSLKPGETFEVSTEIDGFKEGDRTYIGLGSEHTSGEVVIIAA